MRTQLNSRHWVVLSCYTCLIPRLSFASQPTHPHAHTTQPAHTVINFSHKHISILSQLVTVHSHGQFQHNYYSYPPLPILRTCLIFTPLTPTSHPPTPHTHRFCHLLVILLLGQFQPPPTLVSTDHPGGTRFRHVHSLAQYRGQRGSGCPSSVWTTIWNWHRWVKSIVVVNYYAAQLVACCFHSVVMLLYHGSMFWKPYCAKCYILDCIGL